MLTKARSHDIEQMLHFVRAREPLLLRRIAKNNQLSDIEAEELFRETLKFLALTSPDQPHNLTPALLIDEAWHEFILFTRLYQEFCETMFGRFIHHAPGGTERQNHQQFTRALIAYQLVYGTPPIKYWGDHGYLTQSLNCGSQI